jgi:hypothetical protein
MRQNKLEIPRPLLELRRGADAMIEQQAQVEMTRDIISHNQKQRYNIARTLKKALNPKRTIYLSIYCDIISIYLSIYHKPTTTTKQLFTLLEDSF